MKFFIERVSGPDIEPLTLLETKRHLRLFDDVKDSDDDVTELIVAAREWCEDFTGRALVDQVWRLTVEDYESGAIRFYKSPVLALTSFVSVAADGEETVVEDVGSPTIVTYEIRGADSKWPSIAPLTGAVWPEGLLRLEFRAGYVNRTSSPIQDASVIPARIRNAMKIWIGAMWDRDEKTFERDMNIAERILRAERVDMQVG